MSSLYIAGNFAIKDGYVHEIGRSRYVYYSSGFRCTDQNVVHANIRTYDRSNVILPDYTVILLIGKLHIPRGGSATIDCYLFLSYPGDPVLDDYESHIPRFDNPIVFATGPVFSPLASFGEPIERLSVFGAEVKDWVIDGIKQSNLK